MPKQENGVRNLFLKNKTMIYEKEAFKKAKEGGAIVGGDWFE